MRRDLKIKTIDVIVTQFCNRIGKEAWADLRQELIEQIPTKTTPCPKCQNDAEINMINIGVCQCGHRWNISKQTCPHHDIWTIHDNDKKQRIHACLCNGKL